MEISEERLNELIDKRITERSDQRRQGYPVVRQFKEDVKEWCMGHSSKSRNWASIQGAIYMSIKLRLDISNIANLMDDQVPAARDVFEGYKQLVS